MKAAKPRKLPPLTGTQVQDAAIEMAHALGWIIAHFRPAMKSNGRWTTAVAADAAGFPDLVLVHSDRRILWRECKSRNEKLKPEQEIWRDWLLNAGEDWEVWDYRDYPDAIKAQLERGNR